MSDFKLDVEGILTGLANLDTKARTAVSLFGDTAAKKLEEEAKNKASWIDRTGLSRKTITGGKNWDGNKCVVYIAGNTQQFPFLELAHDKKYAILQPTVNKLSPSILKGLSNMLK